MDQTNKCKAHLPQSVDVFRICREKLRKANKSRNSFGFRVEIYIAFRLLAWSKITGKPIHTRMYNQLVHPSPRLKEKRTSSDL